MPHQCVRCGKLYDDGSKELLEGCSICGSKVFFYIKKEKLKESKEEIDLTKDERKQIEKDIYDLISTEIDKDKPIILDIEAIKVLKPGQYEIDLVHLFKNDPVIFKLEDGKYMIDIKKSLRKRHKMQ